MKNKMFFKYIILVILLIVIAVAIVILTRKPNNEEQQYINISIEYKEEEEDTSWKDETYEDIELKTSVNIKKAGTYHITGTFVDRNIIVMDS